MARQFSDSDFAPQEARTFTDADFNDAHDSPRQAADSGEALLTNLPVEGIGQNVARGLPSTLGATIGGALGLPLGPFGVIGGAALGGTIGEGVRQGTVFGTAKAFPSENFPQNTGRQIASDIVGQGVAQGAGAGIGLGIGAAAKAARPFVNKIGAQVMRVGAGIPEKAGMAAMKNPSMLIDAPSQEAASAGYQAFERYTGLKGLGDQVKTMGKFPTEADLEKQLFEVAARAGNGVQSTAQELYHASQAASSLNQLGKLGNPRYAMLKAAITNAKSSVDDALEAILPEYGNLRADYAMSKAAGEFSSLLPLNKNTTPNVLRGVTAATAAGAGIASGNPMAALALPLVSPKFYGGAIRGAAFAGRIPAPIYKVGAAITAGATGSAVEQAYRQGSR